MNEKKRREDDAFGSDQDWMCGEDVHEQVASASDDAFRSCRRRRCICKAIVKSILKKINKVIAGKAKKVTLYFFILFFVESGLHHQ